MRRGDRGALEALKRRVVEVPIAEADATFILRAMNGTERDKFEVETFVDGSNGERKIERMYLRARLVALCLVDDAGQRLYADDEVRMLSDALPADVLQTLFLAAQTLNGMAPGALEDAGKNSASAPVADSPSA